MTYTIRPKSHRRLYGDPRHRWVVTWYWPPQKTHRREFESPDQAEGWVTRLLADPELRDGPRLQRELREARVRRLTDQQAAGALWRETVPAARRQTLRRRSPFRHKPPEPARLGGTIRERRRPNGRVSYAIDYYNDKNHRYTMTLPTRRAATAWRDAVIVRLAGATERPVAAPEPAPQAALSGSPDGLRQDLADIKSLLQSKRVRERNEHENLPAILRRVTEIERHLRLTELHQPPRASRRRPLGD
jgi:hypothetical protein